jgi:hypothetical protein
MIEAAQQKAAALDSLKARNLAERMRGGVPATPDEIKLYREVGLMPDELAAVGPLKSAGKEKERFKAADRARKMPTLAAVAVETAGIRVPPNFGHSELRKLEQAGFTWGIGEKGKSIPISWADATVLEDMYKLAWLGSRRGKRQPIVAGVEGGEADWYWRAGLLDRAIAKIEGLKPEQVSALTTAYSTGASPAWAMNQTITAIKQWRNHEPITAKSMTGEEGAKLASKILYEGVLPARGPKHETYFLNKMKWADPRAWKRHGGTGVEVTVDERMGELARIPFGMVNEYRAALSVVTHDITEMLKLSDPDAAQAAMWVPWKAAMMSKKNAGLPWAHYWTGARDAGESAFIKAYGEAALPKELLHLLKTQTMPEITGRAAGGPVRAGSPYLVGERGPEMFVPQRSGNIIPNHAMTGAAAGQTITINVHGVTDPDTVARKVMSEINRRQRQGAAQSRGTIPGRGVNW